MCLCSLTLEILYALLKNLKRGIGNVHLKVMGWFKTDAISEALLMLLSNLLMFICAQLLFVTAQLVILHNYNDFHTQTGLVAGSKKEIFPHRIPNCATKKRCVQGYSAFNTE